jgi:hypothetical protein
MRGKIIGNEFADSPFLRVFHRAVAIAADMTGIMHETGSAIPQQELHWMTNHNLFIKNWESVDRRAGKCLIWLKVPEGSPMLGSAASAGQGRTLQQWEYACR